LATRESRAGPRGALGRRIFFLMEVKGEMGSAEGRHGKGGRSFPWGGLEEHLGGREPQESRRPCLSGEEPGGGSEPAVGWGQAAGAPVRGPGGFCRGAPERSGKGKLFSDHPTEGSSEGEKAQECGELREASEGLPSEGRREGSQTLRAGRAEEAPPLSYLGWGQFKGNRAGRSGDAEGRTGRARSRNL
jgi:hypothetical protein